MKTEARYIILEDTVLLSKKDYDDWKEIQAEYETYKTNLNPMDCEDTIGYFEYDYKNESDWPFSRKRIIEFFKSEEMILYPDWGQNMLEGMRRYVGKQVTMTDGEIVIYDAYTCYVGDFFKVRYLTGKRKGESVDISISSDMGVELTRRLPEPE